MGTDVHKYSDYMDDDDDDDQRSILVFTILEVHLCNNNSLSTPLALLLLLVGMKFLRALNRC